MSPAPSHADHSAPVDPVDHVPAASVLPETVQVIAPGPAPSAQERSGDAAEGRRAAIRAKLPQGPFEFVGKRSARPSKPSRSLVDPGLVTRSRHGGVQVTWIDREAAGSGVLIHFHGGSYVYRESEQEWAWLCDLRRRAGIAVAMVHYRTAGQLPFPAAHDDAITAVDGILEDLAPLEPGWILSGVGAGGGLALVLAQNLRDRHGRTPSALLLTSPWTDLTRADAARAQQDAADPTMRLDLLERCALLYADGQRREDPRLSPLLGDLHDLPPVHLVTGSDDLLYGDAVRLREGLGGAFTAVDYLVQPGGVHAYPVAWSGPTAQYARRSQIAFVRRILGLETL